MRPIRPTARGSGCLTLDDARPLPPPLSSDDLAALRSIRRRKHLARNQLFLDRQAQIDELTTALAYGRPTHPAPRPERRFLRAVSWNIERGRRLDGVIGVLSNDPILREADLVLLNEVDIGMARSANRDVAREIAEALGFEWVFGNSYLCLSHGDVRDGATDVRAAACQEAVVRPEDNQDSLHGNAILARWPIRRAENFTVEVTRDKFESSDKRLGHKKALWAEVATPVGEVAVAAVHLDPYASPAQRRSQMADVISTVDGHRLPRVLLGGDLNTNTYDLSSLPRLVWNVAAKLWRGGFPHAIDHYMRPHALYERVVFEELAARGFEIEPFNDMKTGSVRYEVGTFDSESKVREHLPGVAAHLLRYKLAPWGGVAPLKIDWFAGRGLRALRAGDVSEASGRRSADPGVLERVRWNDGPISDHDPIRVDFVTA